MQTVSTFRLYLLRAMYLLLIVGLGADLWPKIIHPPANLEHMRGVVWSVLTGVSLMAFLGLRYPLKMLPLLFFEFVWKSIWVLSIGLPRWLAHSMDAATLDTWNACLMGVVIVPIVIPWRYVFANYVSQAGDRWRGADSLAVQQAGVNGLLHKP